MPSAEHTCLLELDKACGARGPHVGSGSLAGAALGPLTTPYCVDFGQVSYLSGVRTVDSASCWVYLLCAFWNCGNNHRMGLGTYWAHFGTDLS